MGNTPDAVRNLSHNHHPSVKPTALMQYLVRLITPKCGVCLDPFMGSGSTGKAALLEGFRFIGIEREVEYFPIAEARIRHVSPNAVKPVERDSCASSNHESPSVQEKLF
jgi:site-specific DNA-methyltransferase (adenine-specific)